MKLAVVTLIAATATLVSAETERCISSQNPIRNECLPEKGPKVGCKDGYCWKACGGRGDPTADHIGQWCWTAISDGGGLYDTPRFGDWHRCKKDSDCKEEFWCAMSKEGGLCPACGCGCYDSEYDTTWAGDDIDGEGNWADKGFDRDCDY